MVRVHAVWNPIVVVIRINWVAHAVFVFIVIRILRIGNAIPIVIGILIVRDTVIVVVIVVYVGNSIPIAIVIRICGVDRAVSVVVIVLIVRYAILLVRVGNIGAIVLVVINPIAIIFLASAVIVAGIALTVTI